MISFPIGDLLDEQACYDFLLARLHPQGLHCPAGHPLPAGAGAHDRHRAPIVDYQCKTCGKVFNIFTRTEWQKTHYTCAEIVQIVRGIAQGTPTLHLARELGLDRGTLLYRRHRIQGHLDACRPKTRKFSSITEADEMYQNAGEKRGSAHGPRRSAPTPRQ